MITDGYFTSYGFRSRRFFSSHSWWGTFVQNQSHFHIQLIMKNSLRWIISQHTDANMAAEWRSSKVICVIRISSLLLCSRFRRLKTSWQGRRSAGCALRRKWLICVFISPPMRSVQKTHYWYIYQVKHNVPAWSFLQSYHEILFIKYNTKYETTTLFMTCFIGQHFICDCLSSSSSSYYYMTSLPVLKTITCRQ